jgi:hypothetical protein
MQELTHSLKHHAPHLTVHALSGHPAMAILGAGRRRRVSKPNQKPKFLGCGCAGWGKPSAAGYSLRHLIAVLDRMNGQPVVSEVKPEPEDERHWARQFPAQADDSERSN